jgi:Holliday junction resolvase RusA-like endonuclease
VAESASAAMLEAGVERTAGRVAVAVTAVVAIPKSYRGKKRIDALIGRSFPGGDVDNFAKSALDGASVLWVDDKQVVQLAASKRWGGEGEEEGMEIEVRYLDL